MAGLNIKRSNEEWLRRYVSFIFILFIIAFGTSLSIRANLGSSPISAPPYILSLIPGMTLSMGMLTICMHVFFIAVQIILLRKDFERRQFAQILVSFLFGFYTDVTMWMTSFMQVPETLNPFIGYPLRFIELLIGGGLLAFGIACEVRCDSLMLAGEGFPLAISRFLKKEFGKVKICTDTMLVCIGTVFMFVYFGHWDWKMVGVGTLVSMFYVGYMVRVFSPHIVWLDKIFIPKKDRNVAAEEDIQFNDINHLVITIAREYGSGGSAIGEKLSQRLGIPCYNRNLIDITASRLGYTTDFVVKSEQNISTSRLWELIFTDKSIPPSMNPSEDDALYVSQSRTIRELANEGPCIIVGRLANWILRDNPNVFRVFVTSDIENAVKLVMEKENLSEKDALKKINRVNSGRANHCWHYTGTQWADIRNYDLMLNTSKTSIDKAVDMICHYIV